MVKNNDASINIALSDIANSNKESQISSGDYSIKIELIGDPPSKNNLTNKQTPEDSPLKKKRFRVNGKGIFSKSN